MKNQPNLPLMLLGKCLGWPLAWILRKQNGVAHKLIGKGLSSTVAKWLLITFNLLVLIAILMMIFPLWIMFIIAFVVFVAYTGIDLPPPPKHGEWRMGTDGFGLYNDLNMRIDGGSIEDEELYRYKD